MAACAFEPRTRKHAEASRSATHLALPVDGIAHLEATAVYDRTVQIEEIQRVAVEHGVGELPRVDRPSKPRLRHISGTVRSCTVCDPKR